ncbi:hypothetical protein WDW86_10780 [Bdellovibrionota bacterium FG-2]
MDDTSIMGRLRHTSVFAWMIGISVLLQAQAASNKCIQDLSPLALPEKSRFVSMSNDGTRMELCSENQMVLIFDTQTRKTYTTGIGCFSGAKSFSADYSRVCARWTNTFSLRCYSSETGKTEDINMTATGLNAAFLSVSGTQVDIKGHGVLAFLNDGTSVAYSFKTGKSVPASGPSLSYSQIFTPAGQSISFDQVQFVTQDTETGTKTTQSKEDLIKACGLTKGSFARFTAGPGVVIASDVAISHCSLSDGKLLQSFPVPPDGYADFNNFSKSLIIRGKTAKESLWFDFDDLKNPARHFPEDLDLTKGMVSVEGGNLVQYIDSSFGGKTVWTHGKPFVPPLSNPYVHGDYCYDYDVSNTVRRIGHICYSGALQIAEDLVSSKAQCLAGDSKNSLPLEPKPDNIARKLLCDKPYAEKDWDLAFPDLYEFKSGKITASQAEALLLRFQKPGALDLVKDAEAIVSLFKSQAVRNNYSIQVGAILQNIAASNPQFYYNLLNEIPELLALPPISTRTSPSSLCRTSDDEKVLSDGLNKNIDFILDHFGEDPAQLIRVVRPLIGHLEKADSPEAKRWSETITNVLLKKSHDGKALAPYAEHPIPYVTDWVKAQLFSTPIPERYDAFLSESEKQSPIIFDNHVVDHNPNLKNYFGFYLKTVSPPATVSTVSSSVSSNVSWTHNDEIKTATLTPRQILDEKTENELLEKVWVQFHGVSFSKSSTYMLSSLTPKGLETIKKYGLTAAEVAAIRGYGLTDYLRLNQGIRDGGEARKQIEPYLKVLNQGLRKLPKYVTENPEGPPQYAPTSKDTGPVRRGTTLPPGVLQDHKVGEVVTYPSYTSTSLEFGFPSIHRFIISSKCGRNIEDLASVASEREVLFLPGARFKILDRKENVHNPMVPNTKQIEFIMKEVDCE